MPLAAGDTRWAMWATGITSTLILVGGGYAMVMFVPELGIVGPLAGVAGHAIVLAGALTVRFRSGAWRKIDLLKRARPAEGVAAVPEPVAPPTVLSVETPEDPDR